MPLLQACCYGNVEVIDKLRAHGANTRVKDLLSYSSAELCLFSGAIKSLLDSCERYKQPLLISDTILFELVKSPALYERVISGCNLDAGAKRFVFSLACSHLDIEKVQQLIVDGYKIDGMVAEFYNPVYEACTSALANHLKGRAFSLMLKTMPNEEMEQRFRLVEVLLHAGISVEKSTKYCAIDLIENVSLLGNIELLMLFEKYRFDMSLDDEDSLAFISDNLSETSRNTIVPYLKEFIKK